MNYREIPLNEYPRRAHFEYFRSLAYPFVGLTAEVDVTGLIRLCKEKGRSFYLSFIHIAALAANSVPALRQRISGDTIREYDFCNTSHTEPLPDGTYCYCTLHHDRPMEEYLALAERERALAFSRGSIEEDGEAESCFFVSCIPWVSYTALVQPVSGDSNPRITWGRFFERDGRTLMPVSLLAHHALVDGAHIGAFYARLEELLREFE